jgi:hypothetical protein
LCGILAQSADKFVAGIRSRHVDVSQRYVIEAATNGVT